MMHRGLRQAALVLLALVAVALGSGCGAITAKKNNGKAPLALYLVDAAAFSAGMCFGMDATFASSRDAREVRAVGGYALALGAWLPYWFTETR